MLELSQRVRESLARSLPSPPAAAKPPPKITRIRQNPRILGRIGGDQPHFGVLSGHDPRGSPQNHRADFILRAGRVAAGILRCFQAHIEYLGAVPPSRDGAGLRCLWQGCFSPCGICFRRYFLLIMSLCILKDHFPHKTLGRKQREKKKQTQPKPQQN